MDFNTTLQKLDEAEKVISFRDDKELDDLVAKINSGGANPNKKVIAKKVGKNKAKLTTISKSDADKLDRAAKTIGTSLGM